MTTSPHADRDDRELRDDPGAPRAVTASVPVATPGAPRLPPSGLRPESGAATERFTERRIERILALVVALGSAVLGTQAFLNALTSTQESTPWHTGLMIAAFGPLALMIVALAVGVLPRTAAAVFALALAVVLACWPFAASGGTAEPGAEPWVWYLLNVASAAAAIAFPLALQLGWTVLVPALYIVARLAPTGQPSTDAVSVVLDAVFAVILGGVIVALGWMLRSVAVGIDRARRDAVLSYAAAAEADAAEAERVAVAALMHDSVLAALIAAERAATPREEALAVAMAREALTRLANAELDAGEGPDEPVPAAALVGGIRRSVDASTDRQNRTLEVREDVHDDAGEIPGRVARAIVLAATQAIANAFQHADGAGLIVTVRADAASVEVRIVDTGRGFDPSDVAQDRLGIRGSIVARMAAVGGRARVKTGPGGTSVLLEWEGVR